MCRSRLKYHASRWISRPDVLGDEMFRLLRPAEFVIFRIGQKTNPGTRTISKRCGDATHAVLVAPRYAICFDTGR